ncbi:MAG: hypothetical protein BGP16_08930 [Sphingobium sp. 66-54]|nr:MAG: hypothetical protein BGP16_08930 [Sphingobium sp. 66-54]
MRKILLGTVAALGLATAATPAFAQGGCDRADLQRVADGYIAAQTAGDAGKLPMGQWVQYTEQLDSSASMSTGILSKPQKIDFHRSFLDTESCSVFSEVIITDKAHPYVLGTVISTRGGAANAVDTLITDADDWLFNAANTLKYSKAEKWTEIPVAERDSRQTIIAAANAYLDYFNDKSITVPWGNPCARLEGGLYTAKGAPGVVSPEDSCDVGVPADTKLVDRRYVVDETIGAVAVLLSFGKNQLPDIHSFRVEKGKIRYVHTITVCKTFNCGFDVPEQLKTSSK